MAEPTTQRMSRFICFSKYNFKLSTNRMSSLIQILWRLLFLQGRRRKDVFHPQRCCCVQQFCDCFKSDWIGEYYRDCMQTHCFYSYYYIWSLKNNCFYMFNIDASNKTYIYLRKTMTAWSYKTKIPIKMFFTIPIWKKQKSSLKRKCKCNQY